MKGEMQEWFNWHAWKACVPLEAGPGVRIPLSPQHFDKPRLAGVVYFSEGLKKAFFLKDLR
jgi:hypothetical protein